MPEQLLTYSIKKKNLDFNIYKQSELGGSGLDYGELVKVALKKGGRSE
jgi:hypothetical protein